MATKSSRILALTNPKRFGLEIVHVFFGEARRCRHQDVALAGDLLRFSGLGDCARIQRFIACENGEIITESVEV